jgi:hypothetical protein
MLILGPSSVLWSMSILLKIWALCFFFLMVNIVILAIAHWQSKKN